MSTTKNVFYKSEIHYLELLRELKNRYPGVIVNPVVETQSVLMRLTGNVINEDSVVYPIEQQGEPADKTAIALTKALLACCFFNNLKLSYSIYGVEDQERKFLDLLAPRASADTEKALEEDFRRNTEEGFKRVAEGEKGLVQQEKETTAAPKTEAPKQETPIVQIGNKSVFYSNKAGVDARLLWTYPNTEEIRIFLRQIGTEPALDKEIKEKDMQRVKKQGVIELLYGK